MASSPRCTLPVVTAGHDRAELPKRGQGPGKLMNKVFIFGTLKEGFPNFEKNKGIRFGHEFETKARYPLYLVGARHSPWLVLDKGNGHNIQGQVFKVSDEALAEMDKLERISAPDGYRRIEITVLAKDSGEEFVVFTYAKPVEQIQGADIRKELQGEYNVEHAAHYRSRNS